MKLSRLALMRVGGVTAALLLGLVMGLLTGPAEAEPFGWQPPWYFGSEAGQPSVAFDAEGRAVVVWTQSGMIWAQNLAPDGGASGRTLIGSGTTPQVVIDQTGDAVIVWSHNGTIWAISHTRQLGPSTPASIGGLGGDPSEPQVAVDSNGRAVVVWIESNETTGGIWSAIFSPEHGWETPIQFEMEAEWVYELRVAASQTGDAIVAVWKQLNPRIGASWFLPEVGWGAPTFLHEEEFFFVGLSSSEEAVLLFGRSSTSGSLTAIHLSQAGSWERPVTTDVDNLYRPQGAVDETGNVSVVWCGGTGHGCWNVWSTRYVPGRGFGPATLVAETAFDFHAPPIIGLDPQGRTAFAAWNEFGLLRASRLLPDGDWGDPTLLANPARNLYQMAVGPTGDALAVWQQKEGDQWRLVARRHVSDFSPPDLDLLSPFDGMTTSLPTVTVTGWTDPQARLEVNGIKVSVSGDGSFSFPLPLSEGTNVIAAIAKDSAGNTATAMVRVTYSDPLPLVEERLGDANDALTETRGSLDSANIELASAGEKVVFLLLLQIVLVASIALLFVLYWNQRRGGPGMGGNPLGTKGRDRPGNPGSGVKDGRARYTREDRPQGSDEYRPWPRTPTESPVHLTARERVVLHLLDYAKYTDTREVPQELTQGGIAKSVGFPRRHFLQYVRPLLGEDLVQQRNAHVEGVLQRQKVYALSYDGWRRALGIRDRIQSAVVSVRYDHTVGQASIGDVLPDLRGAKSILDLVREFVETGQVDLRN